MLTDDQVDRTWEETLAAEVRALYFAELGSTFTNRKQIISGVSFFLASAAAATIVASLPKWVPVLLSALTAAMMGLFDCCQS